MGLGGYLGVVSGIMEKKMETSNIIDMYVYIYIYIGFWVLGVRVWGLGIFYRAFYSHSTVRKLCKLGSGH